MITVVLFLLIFYVSFTSIKGVQDSCRRERWGQFRYRKIKNVVNSFLQCLQLQWAGEWRCLSEGWKNTRGRVWGRHLMLRGYHEYMWFISHLLKLAHIGYSSHETLLLSQSLSYCRVISDAAALVNCYQMCHVKLLPVQLGENLEM